MAATALLTHTWGTTVKNDTGAATLNDLQVIAGSNEFNQKVLVPAGSTAEIDCGSLAFAKMTSLFMTSNSPVTIYTNASDGTGGQVIVLAANKAYGWNNTQVGTNPITANITKIYVNNAAGTKDATFRAGFLVNLLV